MPELYLIAHKVRGEQAFDVAVRMVCPECSMYEYVESTIVAESNIGCAECDQLGFWWIIPTSGHRAYPYSAMGLFNGIPTEVWHDELPDALPDPWPDHYHITAAPEQVRERLENLLARLPKPVKQPIKRR